MSKIVRIIITIVGLIIIAIGAVLWLRNPDSHILPIAFTVVGVVVSFVPAMQPFSSSGARFSRMEGLPRLIVRADRSIVGQAYLLDSELYANVLDRLRNPERRMQYISEQNVDGRPVYGAVFRDLVPGQQYTFWTNGSLPIHITLSPGESRKIDLQIKRGVMPVQEP